MPRTADQLRAIQNFDQLIPFLEEDLEWPFPHGRAQYDFEDLTFQYSAEEVGLESEYAAKIKSIHQLRPLVSGQPWGVFFVEFENKKLPIVVLRRILSHLVLKKRKSANPAERARWNAGDLIFISAFAEEGTLKREIAFAHFHQDPGDQPTLRVLGWDGGDTPLKLEHVAQILKQRLSWPNDTNNHELWRKQWAGAFRYRIGQQIQTADMLARELARVARNIRDAAMALMRVESTRGPLRKMHEAFRAALIHDLDQESFADTYAQTITYGLLTAAISRTDRSAGADGTFVLAEDIHNMVPITNPFLKEMLESFLKVGGRGSARHNGLDFDELGVQEVVELLRSSEIDLPAVLEDFGNRNPGEDPVIRFYEDFLRAYNKELKIKRGVFYTPQPVVSYIVRSVHEVLQTEFGLPDGLASTITWREMAAQMKAAGKSLPIPKGTSPDSHFVVILDPATGTATFIVEAIDIIFRTLQAKWKLQRMTRAQQNEAWNRYVPEHLLPRLYGYELMMAPYAIAHMKIGLKLNETGYKFTSAERVRVYLTNTLEPPNDHKVQREFEEWAPALAHEANAVNEIKRNQRFTVVIGNPPYSKLSQNQNEWITDMMERYKTTIKTEEIQRQALSNDYVKFFCVASSILERAGSYVLGMITDNSYLDGPLFRDMRANLMSSFRFIGLTDLGGNSRRVEATASDQNVFDIQQGVAIFLGHAIGEGKHGISLAEVRGSRDEKSSWLASNTSATAATTELHPTPPQYYFQVPTVGTSTAWEKWTPLPDFFAGGFRSGRPLPFNGAALATRQDSFAVAFTVAELRDKLRVFFDKSETHRSLDEKFGLCSSSHFDFERARSKTTLEEAESCIQPITYRPFDTRYVVYHPLLIGEPRPEVMKHLLAGSLALLSTRRVTGKPYDNVFVCRGLVEYKAATHDRNTQVFPLYLIGEDDGAPLLSIAHRDRKHPNFAASVYEVWQRNLGVESPENVLGVIYALLYSPEYRQQFQTKLQQDYARVPRPSSKSLCRSLEKLGSELISLHLLKSDKLEAPITSYTGPAKPEVVKVSYADRAVWLDRDHTIGFRGVHENIWNFNIGGYQVCEKWLKDRRERKLSKGDVAHYQRIVVAIGETIRLMKKIDEVIEKHGGWPDAFASTSE